MTRLPQATVTEQAMPIISNQYLGEILDVRRRQTLQERPPAPYVPNNEYEFWEPPLNTSDPNYVPRRGIRMEHVPRTPPNDKLRRSDG